MISVLPRSLAGRLTLLLVAAVIIAQGAAIVILAADTSRVRRAAERTQEADHMTALARVIDVAPKDSRNDIIRAFGSPNHEYWTSATPLVAAEGMGTDERVIAEQMRRLLRDRAHDPRIALVERNIKEDIAAGRPDSALPESLEISVRMGDGTWLNGEASLRLPVTPGLTAWRYLLVASVISIVIAVMFAVHWISRPLTALADAAARVGRGDTVELLAVSGPSEVSRTVNAFNIMQRRLSLFLKERLTMLAAISHDLRTPITAARLRAEMIEDPEIRDAIVRSLTDMQHITEATLCFARDETTSEEPRLVDLESLVEAVAEDLRAIGCDITVTPREPLPYRCRAALLRRALSNLMSNAAKYGKRAEVTLHHTREFARITIDDEGPGLPEPELEKVFEPFARLDRSRSNETGGVGLGLSIARSAIRAHGGDVSLTNLAQGLRAEVVLPREGAEARRH